MKKLLINAAKAIAVLSLSLLTATVAARPIEWQSVEGLKVINTDLVKKEGKNNWSSGEALSTRSLSGRQHGMVEFGVTTLGKGLMVGFNHDPEIEKGITHRELDYGLFVGGNKSLRIYEHGVKKADIPNYIVRETDRFRVELKNGKVYYWAKHENNDAFRLIYTSKQPVDFYTTYYVDASIRSVGGGINNAQIYKINTPFFYPHKGRSTQAITDPNKPFQRNATYPLTPSLPLDFNQNERTDKGRAQVLGSNITSKSTSFDNRIQYAGSRMVKINGVPTPHLCYSLVIPERTEGTHLMNGDMQLATGTGVGCIPAAQMISASDSTITSHSMLCDAKPNSRPGRIELDNMPTNPQVCDYGDDCYDLTMIMSTLKTADKAKTYKELWGTKIRVQVANPKTNKAKIVSVTRLSPPKKAPIKVLKFLEPTITGDGRLFVFHKQPGANPADLHGLHYSYLDKPCDVTRFTKYQSISQMHKDPRLVGKYPVASFPIRGNKNELLNKKTDTVSGAYPWIDRNGDNIFFTSARPQLYYKDTNNQMKQRFGTRGNTRFANKITYDEASRKQSDLDPYINPKMLNEVQSGPTRQGVAFFGSWSNGKIILLDGRLNPSDMGILLSPVSNDGKAFRYGFGAADKLMKLYRDSQPVSINGSVTVQLSSVENQFNYIDGLKPKSPRDVAWYVSSNKATDEIAFDDYIIPSSFIVANMMPAVDHKTRRYRDGFDWDESVRDWTFYPEVQNAATGSKKDFGNDLAFNIPSHGTLLGGARTEPVAAGGVKGRGLWLDGENDSLKYTIQAQPNPGMISTAPWFYSMWIDARDVKGKRGLLETPDGSRLSLINGRKIELKTDSLYAMIPLRKVGNVDGGWMHIGLLSKREEGHWEYHVTVNGLKVAKIEHKDAMFRMKKGTLRVGVTRDAQHFKGWIDDFKVIAREPNVEEACNHAEGTLIGIEGSDHRYSLASRQYPQASHDEITARLQKQGLKGYSRYICESKFASNEVYHYVKEQSQCLDHLRQDTAPEPESCIRSAILFPEGPLHHNWFRPESRKNDFCTSCHVNSHPYKKMKGSQALRRFRNIYAKDDLRRQPLQPAPRIFGWLPEALDGPKEGPIKTDNLVLPTR